jgi:hypothetical protein
VPSFIQASIIKINKYMFPFKKTKTVNVKKNKKMKPFCSMYLYCLFGYKNWTINNRAPVCGVFVGNSLYNIEIEEK